MKEFAPHFSRGGDMAMDALPEVEIPALKQMGKLADSQAESKTKGFEVGYDLFAINGRMLGMAIRSGSSRVSGSPRLWK